MEAALEHSFGKWKAAVLQFAQREDHLGRTVERVFVIGRVLVSEPKRQPGTVGALLPMEELDAAVDGAQGAPFQGFVELREPRSPRAQGVRGEVGRAAVERQRAPASAESGNAAVAILQVEQPAHTGDTGLARGRIDDAEMKQSDESTGSVVGIGDAAGKICP